MLEKFPPDPTLPETAVIPRVAPERAPIPVPPEFAPRQRHTLPSRVVIHPGQWQEHLDALEQLARIVRYLVALLAVVLILIGYVTLEAAQIVSAIHSLSASRAGIGV